MYLHIVSPLLLLLLLLQEGVGRRIGEQSEHHWSRAKPWFLLARYMTFAHWWDGYIDSCISECS
jgi:hypothetical protein